MHEITASRHSGRSKGYIAEYRPYAKTLALLDKVEQVLDEYREYWPLTCRQIFYRMVGAHGYDKSEAAYGRLCSHLGNARRARVIPFEAIRDDGVTTYRRDDFENQDHFLRHVRRMGERYTRDKMAAQEIHVEVWCEAAGMLPQLDSVAKPYSVRAYSSGGFDSLTAKKDLADRICRIAKPTTIIHLGDCDPSGVSIFDSVAQDVSEFVMADRPHGLVSVDFRRVALTPAQVSEFDLPTAPAKATDTRSKHWRGGTCQLEALPPDQIARIVERGIRGLIDLDLLTADREAESADRAFITRKLLPGA